MIKIDAYHQLLSVYLERSLTIAGNGTDSFFTEVLELFRSVAAFLMQNECLKSGNYAAFFTENGEEWFFSALITRVID